MHNSDLFLVIDGTEDTNGRSLLVLSALHLVANSLATVQIRVLYPNEVVRTAAEGLRWETGLFLEFIPPEVSLERCLAGAALYVAIAWRTTLHLPLDRVATAGVRSLVAVQFPEAGMGIEQAVLATAAHDTGELRR